MFFSRKSKEQEKLAAVQRYSNHSDVLEKMALSVARSIIKDLNLYNSHGISKYTRYNFHNGEICGKIFNLERYIYIGSSNSISNYESSVNIVRSSIYSYDQSKGYYWKFSSFGMESIYSTDHQAFIEALYPHIESKMESLFRSSEYYNSEFHLYTRKGHYHHEDSSNLFPAIYISISKTFDDTNQKPKQNLNKW